MKLIYIAEWIGPVFQSQVIELLNALYAQNEIESITLLVAVRSDRDKSFVKTLHPDIEVFFFQSVPLYPIVDMIMMASLKKVLSKIDITPQTVFHTRSEYMGIVFYKAFKKVYDHEPKLLVDIRGVILEEISYYMKSTLANKIKLTYLKNIYKIFFTDKYMYTAVTEELKKYLITTYKIDSDHIEVNHCVAGNNFKFHESIREEVRERLAIKEDEVLFVFSTSSDGGKWQNSDDIASSLVDKGHKILMLTKKEYDHDSIISQYVPYKEVPQYLMAADIGIIIRDDNIVNNVASPIKFSEYLACGLPVIANDSVALISSTINSFHCGLILNTLNELTTEKIQALTQIDREEISIIGQKLFGVNHASRKFVQIYRKLINE